ncbi:MAG: MFS transporter [Saccharofermentanales bacterium]|jgi:DHA3 family macrolide efflux protein-like MFS transporter|nr:MFS transporter [Bacillota bacterium]NLB08059.1 MFS transporter [Clostridiales bacterium]
MEKEQDRFSETIDLKMNDIENASGSIPQDNEVPQSETAPSDRSWVRNAIIMFSGQLASQLGSAIVQFALIWYVTLRTNSGLAMTLITLAGYVPQLLIAPLAGVWADRYSRKWVMIISDGSIALATLLVAIMFLIGYDAMWLIYIVTGIRSFGSGIHSPAITSIVPQVVPRRGLVRTNAIYHGASNLILLAAPALGGVAVSIMPMWQIFMIDVVTASIAIFCLFVIKIPEGQSSPDNKAKTSQWQEMIDGFKYVRSHTIVFAMLSVYTVFMILISPGAALLPLYIRRNFGLDPFNITITQMAIFSGMALGGLLVAKRGEFLNKVHTLRMAGGLIALIMIALGLLGYAKWAVIWMFGLVLFLFGLVVPFYTTNSTVFLQEEVPRRYQGRTFALQYMVGSFAIPMGTVFFGPLADIVSIQSILIAVGIAQLLVIVTTRPLFHRLAAHLYYPEQFPASKNTKIETDEDTEQDSRN